MKNPPPSSDRPTPVIEFDPKAAWAEARMRLRLRKMSETQAREIEKLAALAEELKES